MGGYAGDGDATEVEISRIHFDPALQPRVRWPDKGHLEALKERRKAGKPLPPVKLFLIRGDDRLYLADGWHTTRAEIDIGGSHISAVVTDAGGDPDGGWERVLACAVGANAEHGLNRTNEDKRRAVRMVLAHKPWARRSSKWIAEMVGVSPKFVIDYRRLLEGRGEVEPCPTVETSDGGTQPATLKPPSEEASPGKASSDDGATDADEPAVVTGGQVSPPGTPGGQTCAALAADGAAHLARAAASFSRAAGADGADDDDRDWYVLADEVRQLARRWRVG